MMANWSAPSWIRLGVDGSTRNSKRQVLWLAAASMAVTYWSLYGNKTSASAGSLQARLSPHYWIVVGCFHQNDVITSE